ncbi:MAG TPA: hypothetical protein PK910_08935 [Bacteroidales bacterium]|nr:hypothetical protein [Bacteroidales bacterium]
MKIEIRNSDIKPLIANLLRINIGSYLKTSDYDHLALEHNFDQLWESANKEIRRRSNVVFLGFDNSGDYEEAFQLILDTLWSQDKNGFFNIMELTLKDFIRWDKGKTDLSKILQNLEQLDMPQSQLENLRVSKKIKVQPEQPSAPEKQIEFKQSTVKVNEKLCFIIMPFTDKLNPIYDSIIKPVIKDLKLECLRADEIFTSKPIIEDIWDNVKKARFLIADLTERNPNVFYELGLAHALNKEVILLTQDINDVPFDLRHFRIIVYQDSISGADKLKSTLKDFINEQINGKKK